MKRLLVLVCAALASLSAALGDFPCAGTTNSQSCSDWSLDPNRQGNITADAECTKDPVNPDVSYCGYARSSCKQNWDCDFGSCYQGKCYGYLGDPCKADIDCQAFFFCGMDGMCGGQQAACANGDASSPIPNPGSQCLSGNCIEPWKQCADMSLGGTPNGYPCSNNVTCSSKFCDPVQLLCTVVENGTASPVAPAVQQTSAPAGSVGASATSASATSASATSASATSASATSASATSASPSSTSSKSSAKSPDAASNGASGWWGNLLNSVYTGKVPQVSTSAPAPVSSPAPAPAASSAPAPAPASSSSPAPAPASSSAPAPASSSSPAPAPAASSPPAPTSSSSPAPAASSSAAPSTSTATVAPSSSAAPAASAEPGITVSYAGSPNIGIPLPIHW